MKFIKYFAVTLFLLALLTGCSAELPANGETNQGVPFELLFKPAGPNAYEPRHRIKMNAEFSRGMSFGPGAKFGKDIRLGLVSLRELSTFDLTVKKVNGVYEIIGRN